LPTRIWGGENNGGATGVKNLEQLDRLRDASQLGLRLLTGSFLMHETWDNVVSAARMAEFAAYLAHYRFPMPALLAPLSVWVQFACGALLVLGLFTRWTGLLIAANFVVGVVMVHWHESFRGWWPAIVLVFIGLHFAAHGAGRYSLDSMRKR
jgi:putative oxidoreductase